MIKQLPNRLISDTDEDDTVEPAGPDVRRAPKQTETRTPRRRDGKGSYPGRRQVTSYIDRQLFLWLKSISAQTEKPMVEIFEEALSKYVESFAAQKKFGQS